MFVFFFCARILSTLREGDDATRLVINCRHVTTPRPVHFRHAARANTIARVQKEQYYLLFLIHYVNIEFVYLTAEITFFNLPNTVPSECYFRLDKTLSFSRSPAGTRVHPERSDRTDFRSDRIRSIRVWRVSLAVLKYNIVPLRSVAHAHGARVSSRPRGGPPACRTLGPYRP